MTLRSSVMLLFCVSSVGIAMRSQRSSVGGNYRLLICREGCGEADTSRAYIVGTLALSDTAIRSQQEKLLFYLIPTDTVLRSRRMARLAATAVFSLIASRRWVTPMLGLSRVPGSIGDAFPGQTRSSFHCIARLTRDTR